MRRGDTMQKPPSFKIWSLLQSPACKFNVIVSILILGSKQMAILDRSYLLRRNYSILNRISVFKSAINPSESIINGDSKLNKLYA